MDILETFSRRLRDRREIMGLTQAQLGKLIGVSSQTVSAYEKNIQGNEKGKSPTLDKIIEIANALAVTLDWLCGIDNQGNTEVENYGEAAELIDRLLLAFPESRTWCEPIGFPDDDISKFAHIRILDETLADYFDRREKMAALLKEGTIDETLYKSWFDGEKAKLSKRYTILPF